MNMIKKKLNSERGASITWALLIFLVCAVVGSAVLVAGTTASGRMSQIAENDQRYYAVNSAARLLCAEIPKETVIIEETSKIDGSEAPSYTVNGGTFDPTNITSFLTLAAYQMGYLGPAPSGSTIANPATLNITVGGDYSNTEKEALQVQIQETAFPDGRLVFDISKGTSEKAYTLHLTFMLSPDSESDRTVDETGETETITRKLQWKLYDIESGK